jgi:general secretion pathway protein K
MTRARQRGFALLLVLLAVGLLSLLITRLLADGRGAVAAAEAVRDAAVAQAAADGVVQQAIFQIQRGAWRADGMPRELRVGPAEVEVVAESLSGRLNPNRAGQPLLAALMVVLGGAAPAQAMQLAGEMVDWRTNTVSSLVGGLKADQYRAAGLNYLPSGRPFVSVDEIGLVPGMTPTLLNALRPYLSVYQPDDPVAGDASTLRAALPLAESFAHRPPVLEGTGPARVVALQVLAVLPGGAARARRSAVVQLGASGAGAGETWQILDWK